MPTRQNDRDFAAALASPETWLDAAIEWIGTNLNPEDVFSENALSIWARDNGFKED